VHIPSPSYTVESRAAPFQEGEDGEDILAIQNLDALVTPDALSITPSSPLVTHQESSARQVTQEQASYIVYVLEGPISCSHAKKLQHKLHAFLVEIIFDIPRNVILPNILHWLYLGIYVKRMVELHLERKQTRKKRTS
jgi:hypothetical protein